MLRLIRGDAAPQVETMIWRYAFGAPSDHPVVNEPAVAVKEEAAKTQPDAQLMGIIRALNDANIVPEEAFAKLVSRPLSSERVPR